jgi:ubiquinone/menaquinone biosynthesis C-methylase UbiE
MTTLYDHIGSTYARSRHADPALVHTIAQHIELSSSGTYLDVACGTGNYTAALSSLGGTWNGVDISAVMLTQARSKTNAVSWLQSDATTLPFRNGLFDGAICTLAIHHFDDLERSFGEVRRVLRSGSFVIFTGLAEQMRRYWLCHYFPVMMARSIEKMPSEVQIRDALVRAGFSFVKVAPFYVTNELQDLFLYSGKYRPYLYLDSVVRANISSFATLAPSDELERGLAQLNTDLQDTAFASVQSRYNTEEGDYAFVVARTDG